MIYIETNEDNIVTEAYGFEKEGCIAVNKEEWDAVVKYKNYGIVFENNKLLVRDSIIQEVEEERKSKEAAKTRNALMLEGSIYTLNGIDYKVSFTKDDGDGMIQVKNGFDLGLENTVIHFDCGTKMPITSSEFLVFAKWFVTERNKFFIEA